VWSKKTSPDVMDGSCWDAGFSPASVDPDESNGQTPQALLNAALQRHLSGYSDNDTNNSLLETTSPKATSAWQINAAQYPSLGFGGADWSLDSLSPNLAAAWTQPLSMKTEEMGSPPSPTFSNSSPTDGEASLTPSKNTSNNGNGSRREGNGARRGSRSRQGGRNNAGQRRSPITARAPVWASSDWHPAANLTSSPPSGSPGTPSKGSGTGVFLPLALRQQMEKEQQMQANNSNQHAEGSSPCVGQASNLNNSVSGGVSA